MVAQSFVDLVQRKIDDKVLKAPHGEEGNRLKESGWLAEIEQRFTGGPPTVAEREELVREAYLRCLGRPPAPLERERANRHLESSAQIRESMEDLLWALVNTKEFLMNH